jgi:dihydroorotate dehydrogenase electron transfer subunit
MDEKQVHVWQASVLENRQKAQGIFELILSCPCADEFKLGQFLCLKALHPESVMSRPFSLYARNLPKGTISILYRVVGKNTALMRELKPGEKIEATGPLGRVIKIPELLDYKKFYLVGGGIGLAALCRWQNELQILGTDHEIFYGNKTQAEAVRSLELIGKVPIHLATDDGSDGYHGLVTDLFEQRLVAAEATLVLTCGPKVMMQRVAEICAEKKVDCWVMLETTMACGLDNCKGCSIKTKSGQKSVCKDGPVFDAKEVIWNELP